MTELDIVDVWRENNLTILTSPPHTRHTQESTIS